MISIAKKVYIKIDHYNANGQSKKRHQEKEGISEIPDARAKSIGSTGLTNGMLNNAIVSEEYKRYGNSDPLN